MAGTGYHPEGHVWVPYVGTLKGARWICANCDEIATGACETECVDDEPRRTWEPAPDIDALPRQESCGPSY